MDLNTVAGVFALIGVGAFFGWVFIFLSFLQIYHHNTVVKRIQYVKCPKCNHKALNHVSNYHSFKARHYPDDPTYSACCTKMWKEDKEGMQRESSCICDMSFREILKTQGVDEKDKAAYNICDNDNR